MRPDGAEGGAVVRALVSHRCGPGSNPAVVAIYGWRVLLVLSLALRGLVFFFERRVGGGGWYSVFLLSSKTEAFQITSNSIWNALVIKTC